MSRTGVLQNKCIRGNLALVRIAILSLGCALLCGCSDKTEPERDQKIELLVLSSGEKIDWLRESAETFSDQRRKKIVITIEALPSQACIDAVLNGTKKAHLICPSYTGLVEEARAENPSLFSKPQSLFFTPQVFALQHSLATALGWPDAPIGWRELSALAGSLGEITKGISTSDLEEFTLFLPDPEATTSGRLALFSILISASGRNETFETLDLDRPQPLEFLASFTNSIRGLGSFSSPALASLCRGGKNAPSVAIITEQEVYAAYTELKPASPIVAIRPREGCYVFDHPACVITAPWTSEAQQDAASEFVDFLLEPEQQLKANERGFRPANAPQDALAPLDPARGIDPSPIVRRFALPSPAAQSMALDLWRKARPGADVVFLFDLSASMSCGDGGRSLSALKIAGRIVDSLGPKDTIALYVFNHERVLAIRPTPVKTARDRFIQVLTEAKPVGGAALIDSLCDVINEDLAAPLPGRIPAIIILSDGFDTHSRMSVLDCIVQMTRENAEGRLPPIFAVGFGGDLEMDVLQRLAKAAGGRVYDVSEATEDEIARDIAAFL